MMTPSRILLLTVVIASGSGCTPPRDDREIGQPPGFVGSWVRQRSDGTWGDTLELTATGTVRGSTGWRVPPDAKWGVRSRAGVDVFCFFDARDFSCKSFNANDSVLTLRGARSEPTVYKRVGVPRRSPSVGP